MGFLFFYNLPNREHRNGHYNPGSFEKFGVRLFGDEGDYSAIAENLATKNIYSKDGEQLTAYRPPLWPILLSIIYRFSGPKALYGMMLNCLLATCVIILTYFFTKKYWGPNCALLAMLVINFDPNTLKYFCHLLTETLYSFLLLLLIITFPDNKDSSIKPRDFILPGFLAGLASLTRAEGALLLPIVLLYLAINIYSSNKGQVLRFGFVFIFSFSIALTPWILRNWLTMHSFIPLTTNSGTVFAGAHNIKVLTENPGGWLNCSQYLETAKLTKIMELPENERNRYLWHFGISTLEMMSFPQIAKLEWLKFRALLAPEFDSREGLPGLITSVLNIVVIIICYAFLIAITIDYKNSFPYPSLILLVFMVPVVTALIFYGGPRFRVPYEPLMIGLTVGNLCSLKKNIQNEQRIFR